MAINYAEDHIGRGGTNAGADDNSDTRSWIISTDDKHINKPQIEEHAFSGGYLPRPMIDRHPDNPWMLCRSLEIRQQDDKGALIWRATARYDTKPLSKEEEEKQQIPDPTQRSAVYSGGFERDQRARTKNVDGKAIVNAAGDPFIEPVLVPFSRLRIRGRMNVAPDAVPDWFYDLIDKTNEDPFERGGREFEEQTLLFIPGEITDPQIENEVEFVTIHWELEYRAEGWKERRVQNGFNQLVYNPDTGVNDLHVPIEIDGARPTEPQLLSDTGRALTKDEIAAGTYFEIEEQTIETGDFDQLP